MAAEALKVNTAPQIHGRPQTDQREQQAVAVKSRNDAYTLREEQRLSKVIWSVVISVLIVITAVAASMYFKGTSENLDSKLIEANETLFDAREHYNEMNSVLQKMVTPDKIAAYAGEHKWVKIPDGSKNYASGDAVNKLDVSPEN